MNVRNALVISILTSIAPLAAAQTPADSNQTPVALESSPGKEEAPIGSFFMDYLDYEQRIHSTSQNTEVGEKTKLDAAFKYRFNPNTSIRLRLDIDPYKYPEENKASKFEVRLFHSYKNFEIQGDFDINGDDNGRGATTFGPDDDSDDSFMTYKPFSFLKAIFYPYNFGGEIGNEYRTLDVTRVFYIEGTPSVINEIPQPDERIRTKTIPGFELQIFPMENLLVYAGIGSTSFYYPASENFDIKNQTAANVWKIKEDRGYKAGLRFDDQSTKVVMEYVTHSNSALTGSLLESASSVQVQHKVAKFIVDLERTDTKAGSKPYRLAKDWKWFENDRGYNPIFVDYYRNDQNWLGKAGSASMIKLGYDFGELTPFVAYKTISENFIFRKRESAEKLRTVDETQSHGGMVAWKFGTEIKAGQFVVRPEVEHFQAENAVYGNRSDLQEFNINNKSYGKKNTVFTLFTTYQY